ncbi:ubiquitin-associated/translation elongation factor ef1b [Anaeramoeba flamelloides]|uniref:Ubiquitin-associated/translation elongation factor ef1b n=1 Tax=Anaeramoeba flamelloides TaxID=1746091 RepID=A0ABQ8YHS7_9EUKA|nr:ubiquitin-associated/translation elongation factor ef1b [Anaeramoeba flamelloides]
MIFNQTDIDSIKKTRETEKEQKDENEKETTEEKENEILKKKKKKFGIVFYYWMTYSVIFLLLIFEMHNKKWTAKYVSSLYNESSSPGWSIEETKVLRECIRRYGYSNWDKIIQKNLIPGKTHSQLYHHSMRLCGQQSLCLFKGIHFDVNHLYLDNLKKTGKNFKRKGCLIINQKSKLSEHQKKEQIIFLIKRYQLPSENIKKTTILRLKNSGQYEQILKRRLLLLKMLQKVHKLRIQKENYLKYKKKSKKTIKNITKEEVQIQKEKCANIKKNSLYEIIKKYKLRGGIIQYQFPENKKVLPLIMQHQKNIKVNQIKLEKIQFKNEQSKRGLTEEQKTKKRRTIEENFAIRKKEYLHNLLQKDNLKMVIIDKTDDFTYL